VFVGKDPYALSFSSLVSLGYAQLPTRCILDYVRDLFFSVSLLGSGHRLGASL
jgi:hypothetical protein